MVRHSRSGCQGSDRWPGLCKLLAVAHRQSLHSGEQWLELGFNGTAHQIIRLVVHIGQHSKSAFAFYQCHYGLFVSCANDACAHSVAYLLSFFNVAWSSADRAAVLDSPVPDTHARLAFAPRLLTAQMGV
jgi:hypothetical protein